MTLEEPKTLRDGIPRTLDNLNVVTNTNHICFKKNHDEISFFVKMNHNEVLLIRLQITGLKLIFKFIKNL